MAPRRTSSAAQPPSSRSPIDARGRARGELAWATLDSPVGKLLLASTLRGLVTVAYLDHGQPEAVLAPLAERLSLRLAARTLDGPRRQLDEYFAARRRRFALPLDWGLTAGFGRRVLAATARIPYGSLASYAAVAAQAGSPHAARAAGGALGTNPLAIVVPCHRVVRSSGALGGYSGGLERKSALLELEGAIQPQRA